MSNGRIRIDKNADSEPVNLILNKALSFPYTHFREKKIHLDKNFTVSRVVRRRDIANDAWLAVCAIATRVRPPGAAPRRALALRELHRGLHRDHQSGG